MKLLDRCLTALMPLLPRALVWRVAKRYVAGVTLEDALSAVRDINSRGASATLDILGEEISTVEEADRNRDAYIELLDAIDAGGVDANISIKPTAFGLHLDEGAAFERVKAVLMRARDLGNFMRIDMEDSSTTTATLGLYRSLRGEGFTNVGIVLQAYMHRTLQDISDHTEWQPDYRLCKGIYVEPEEVAIQGRGEINDNYMAALQSMLRSGSFVGIATHDHALVDRSMECVASCDSEGTQHEFQMLLGVDPVLGGRILNEGHRLRIYVPFGHDWYAYSTRRLQENPTIGRYVFKALFRRKAP